MGGKKLGNIFFAMVVIQFGGEFPESFLAKRLVVMTPITSATVTINMVVAKNIPEMVKKQIHCSTTIQALKSACLIDKAGIHGKQTEKAFIFKTEGTILTEIAA